MYDLRTIALSIFLYAIVIDFRRFQQYISRQDTIPVATVSQNPEMLVLSALKTCNIAVTIKRPYTNLSARPVTFGISISGDTAMGSACLRRKLAPSRNSDDDVNDGTLKSACNNFWRASTKSPIERQALLCADSGYEQSCSLAFVDIHNIIE